MLNQSLTAVAPTNEERIRQIQSKNVVTASEILELKELAARLVGGKNANMAILNGIEGIEGSSYRAVTATAYNTHLDTSMVNATRLRAFVTQAITKYDLMKEQEGKISRSKFTEEQLTAMKGIFADITKDQLSFNSGLKKEKLEKMIRATNLEQARVDELLKVLSSKVDQADFVLEEGLAYSAHNGANAEGDTTCKLRDFINSLVAEAKQTLAQDQLEDVERYQALQLLSIGAQIGILSTSITGQLKTDIEDAYDGLNADEAQECKEAEDPPPTEAVKVAVRSSAVGEDSDDAAFAGAQDTYLFRQGKDDVVLHVLRDFASGFNIRALEYRLSQIEIDVAERGRTKIEALAAFDFNNIAVSVVIQNMVDAVVAGTAFSVDTASGLPDVVSIDTNWGLGETVVGGRVTPDNYLVINKKLTRRTMGVKTIKMVVKPEGQGTHEVDTTPNERRKWTLTPAQEQEIARMVKLIEKKYGKYVDCEFAVNKRGRVKFVQVRPETNHNKWIEQNPGMIKMRRWEVVPAALKSAVCLIKGKNGASKGAKHGVATFVERMSTAMVAAFQNGLKAGRKLVLVAERTDPDFLPLFKRACAVIADVGGRTSHAAVTSRELHLPAVIGVDDLSVLQAMDGKEVTVDGTRGNVYAGSLPLEEVGEDIDVNKIKATLLTQTAIGLILADVDEAKAMHKLREVPDFKVGLLRAEFVLGSIGVHYKALKAHDFGIYTEILDLQSKGKLDAKLKEIQDKGTNKQLVPPSERELLLYELVQNTRKMVKDKQKEQRDVAVALLANEELRLSVAATILDPATPTAEVNPTAYQTAMRIAISNLDTIIVKIKTGESLDKAFEREISNVAGQLDTVIADAGYKSGKEYYVENLSQQIAVFAHSFRGRDVIYRTTDYKSNEYANLTGGKLFEGKEDNPMLGWRGVSRGVDAWEAEAFSKARGEYQATNLHIMLPFVRTETEIARTVTSLRNMGIRSGVRGLKVFVMAEIPSVASLPARFLKWVDGFSIGVISQINPANNI